MKSQKNGTKIKIIYCTKARKTCIIYLFLSSTAKLKWPSLIGGSDHSLDCRCHFWCTQAKEQKANNSNFLPFSSGFQYFLHCFYCFFLFEFVSRNTSTPEDY